MKFDRIVLFVMGSSDSNPIKAEEMQNEIKERIKETCEKGKGSEYGACFAVYKGGSFADSVKDVLLGCQADHGRSSYRIDANNVNCVFIINNALSANEWADCISKTRTAVESDTEKCSYYAIYQRDDMDDSAKMADVLAEANIPVYCFQQRSDSGDIILGETDERQLMAYYAILAGAGMLYSERGIYTGSFDKLTLDVKDFSRIRNHFIVKGIADASNRETYNNDVLFNAFLGAWVGKDVVANDVIGLRDAMRQKLKDYFPGAEVLAALANSDNTRTNDNIKRFIELNFTSERFERFADSFVQNGKDGEDSKGIVKSWVDHCRRMLNANVEYYCTESVDYINKILAVWLRKAAAEIMNEACDKPNRVSTAGGKDFIASAVNAAFEAMNPYVDMVSARILEEISDKLEEMAEYIRKCLKDTLGLFESRKWLLDEHELDNYRHYADTIINSVITFCRSNNLPQSAIKHANDFFGGSNKEYAWTELIEAQNRRVADHVASAQTPIAELIDMEAAEFNEKIGDKISSFRYRLYLRNAQVKPAGGSPKTIYMLSDKLVVDTQGKKLPSIAGGGYEKIEISDFENLLQFTVTRLAVDSDGDDSTAGQRSAVLKALPDSKRYVKKHHENTFAEGATKASVQHDSTRRLAANEYAARAEVVGNMLKVYLPFGMSGAIDYELKGFTASGTRTTTGIRNDIVGGAPEYVVKLDGFFGRCEIVMRHKGEKFLETEFNGPKIDAIFYTRPRVLFGKSRSVRVNGTSFEAERHVFKLEKNVPSVEACLNITGEKNGFLYPIGSGTKWEVWVGESVTGAMSLEACDKEGIRRLEENDK